jgi:hypothetical protein
MEQRYSVKYVQKSKGLGFDFSSPFKSSMQHKSLYHANFSIIIIFSFSLASTTFFKLAKREAPERYR